MAIDPATAATLAQVGGKLAGAFDLFGGGNPAHQTSLVNLGFDGRVQSGGGKLGNAPGAQLGRAITEEFKRFGDALGIKPIGSEKAGITVRVLGNPNAGDRSGQSAYTVFAGPVLSRIESNDITTAVQRGAVQNLKRNDGTAIFGAAIPKAVRSVIKSSSATSIDQLLNDVAAALSPPKAATATAQPKSTTSAKLAQGANERVSDATLNQSPLRSVLPVSFGVDTIGGDATTNYLPLLLAGAAYFLLG